MADESLCMFTARDNAMRKISLVLFVLHLSNHACYAVEKPAHWQEWCAEFYLTNPSRTYEQNNWHTWIVVYGDINRRAQVYAEYIDVDSNMPAVRCNYAYPLRRVDKIELHYGSENDDTNKEITKVILYKKGEKSGIIYHIRYGYRLKKNSIYQPTRWDARCTAGYSVEKDKCAKCKAGELCHPCRHCHQGLCESNRDCTSKCANRYYPAPACDKKSILDSLNITHRHYYKRKEGSLVEEGSLVVCGCERKDDCWADSGKCDGEIPIQCDPFHTVALYTRIGPNKNDIVCNPTCPHRKWGIKYTEGKQDNVFDASRSCTLDCHCKPDKIHWGKCYMKTGECPPDVECESGWSGPFCQTQCEGDYGTNCNKACHCANDDDCDPTSGACPSGCSLHFYGTDCQSECPVGKYDSGNNCSSTCHCIFKDQCVASSGECLTGCLSGYTGQYCETDCQYGINCETACHCRTNEACDSRSGKCKDGCAARFAGTNCQKTCKDGKFGIPDCNGVCHCNMPDQCDINDGTCYIGGCEEGWGGDRCQTDCTNNYNKQDCDVICHCVNGELCNPETGYCENGCDARFYGQYCKEKPCDDGKYLLNLADLLCTGECHCKKQEFCRVKDGSCYDYNCSHGYLGPPECKQRCKYGGDECIGRCHCENNGTCDPLTGKCHFRRLCDIRYYGSDCSKYCPPNKAQDPSTGNCDIDCNCLRPHGCRAHDAACLKGRCEYGWGRTGLKCNRKCIYGFCDRLISIPCNCLGGADCDQYRGDCPRGLCDIRHYRTKNYTTDHCQGTCPAGKYRKNGACNGKCNCLNNAKCNVTDGTCERQLCAIGYRGAQCDRQCKPKKFGYRCEKDCHCEHDMPCHFITGKCNNECKRRWGGVDCQITCPQGKFGCSKYCHCVNQSSCRVGDGECRGSCSPGYLSGGKGINNCQIKCERGKFGHECKGDCHCEGGKVCSHVTGKCAAGCAARYTGNTCNQTCTTGKYNFPKCDKDCMCDDSSFCSVVDGFCLDGKCRTSEPCKKACTRRTYYTPDCDKKCNCENEYFCHPQTGECPFRACAIRFNILRNNIHCSGTCNETKFQDAFAKCTRTCRCVDQTKCNVTSGDCSGSMCIAGYTGNDCQKTCENKTSGTNCRYKCHCKNNTQCNIHSGRCDKGCDSRHYNKIGDDPLSCRGNCPANKFLKNGKCKGTCHCSNIGQCRITDGFCMDKKCVPGWGGDKCQKVCVRKYGRNCENECHCRDNLPCDRISGDCKHGCALRFMGANCNQTCDTGYWEPKTECGGTCQCYNVDKCHVKTGVCDDGQCRDVRHTGIKCTLTCPANKYFYKGQCAGVCLCKYKAECRVSNGYCDGACNAGYRGIRCNDTCLDWTWGPGCGRTCHCKFNETCGKIYGECKKGCSDAYVGQNCQQKRDYSKEFAQVTGYAGGALCVVVIAVILGLFVSYKQKKNRESVISKIELVNPALASDIRSSKMSLAGVRRMSVARKLSMSISQIERTPSQIASLRKHLMAYDADESVAVDTEMKSAVSRASRKRRRSSVTTADDATVAMEMSGTSRRKRRKSSVSKNTNDTGLSDASEATVAKSTVRSSSRRRSKSRDKGTTDGDSVAIEDDEPKSTVSQGRDSDAKSEADDTTRAGESSRGSKRRRKSSRDARRNSKIKGPVEADDVTLTEKDA